MDNISDNFHRRQVRLCDSCGIASATLIVWLGYAEKLTTGQCIKIKGIPVTWTVLSIGNRTDYIENSFGLFPWAWEIAE